MFEIDMSKLYKLLRLFTARSGNFVVDSQLQGLVGNIVGELRSLENQKVNIESRVKNIVDSYHNDPVIHAYLSKKEGWEKEISFLEGKIARLENEEGDWDE